jgi:hypothetical protein
MMPNGNLRARSPKVLLSALFALGTVSLTGCVGVLPNSNTEVGREKVSEIHSVVYKVKAPFGTKVTYTNGQNVASATTNNLGEWVHTADVKGIVSVTISMPEGDGIAECLITVDGTQVAQGMSNCKGTTSKT